MLGNEDRRHDAGATRHRTHRKVDSAGDNDEGEPNRDHPQEGIVREEIEEDRNRHEPVEHLSADHIKQDADQASDDDWSPFGSKERLQAVLRFAQVGD